MATFDWANASVAKVLDLYIAWFNRVPDVAGMASWIARLQAGESLESVSTQFLAAAYQYTDQTGYTAAMSDHQFIVKLYEGVLGRTGSLAPNAEETSYWVRALNNDLGGNRGEMVLRMLAEAKAFDAQGRPEIQAVIDTLNNKTLVSKYALDQGVSYASAELSIIQGKAFLDGVDGTVASVNEARAEVDTHISAANIPTLSVEQVRMGDADGGAYRLLDSLANIVGATDIRMAAASYMLSNPAGLLGELSVDHAVIMNGAGNAGAFTFAVADTVQKVLAGGAAHTALMQAAQAVVVKGTDAGTEVLDLTAFPRGVIIDAGEGNDHLYGTAFSDLLIGGRSLNFYRGNGGDDILQLADNGQDMVYLTQATAGGEFKAGQRIYVTGFGAGDKIVLSQLDIAADLQGSFTADDLLSLTQPDLIASLNQNFGAFGDSLFASNAHAFGVIEFEGKLRAGADISLATDGSQLLQGLGVGPSDAETLYVREVLKPDNFKPYWKGFLIAYDDDNQAYVYYARDTGDNALQASDIKLVGVFEAPAGAAAQSWLTTEHFQI